MLCYTRFLLNWSNANIAKASIKNLSDTLIKVCICWKGGSHNTSVNQVLCVAKLLSAFNIIDNFCFIFK